MGAMKFPPAANLLEVVALERAVSGYGVLADDVRAVRRELGLDLRAASRAVYLPAPALLDVELKTRGFATVAGYDLVRERMRTAAAHRARQADKVIKERVYAGRWTPGKKEGGS